VTATVTHGASPASLRDTFRDRGFVVLPKLFDDALVATLLERLERRSRGARGEMPNGTRAWTAPDGVTRNAEFWPVIFHAPLRAAARALLGDDPCFLQHTDLHVGFSSFNWHRDSVSRTLGVGPDWDEHDAPYRLVRCGIYLQAPSGQFRLGLVPGSHRLADPRAARARLAVERGASWLGHVRRLATGRVPDVPGAEWVAASAGDAVLFDPRVLHTGTPVDGAKYSVFVAYGVPNRHFVHHARYYRFERKELGYGPIAPALVEQLRAAGLHHPVDAGPAPAAATRPTLAETLIMARRRAH